MDVRITVRRGRAGESFRSLAEEKARKLAKYDPRMIRVELLFDEEGGTVRAEARALVPTLGPLVARAEGESRRTALDRVIRKASRRLRDERARRVAHRAPPVTAAVG